MGTVIDPDPHVMVNYDRIPKHEVEIRRSSGVMSADGHHLGPRRGLSRRRRRDRGHRLGARSPLGPARDRHPRRRGGARAERLDHLEPDQGRGRRARRAPRPPLVLDRGRGLRRLGLQLQRLAGREHLHAGRGRQLGHVTRELARRLGQQRAVAAREADRQERAPVDRDRDPRLDERDRPRRALGVEVARGRATCPSPRSGSARRRPRRAARACRRRGRCRRRTRRRRSGSRACRARSSAGPGAPAPVMPRGDDADGRVGELQRSPTRTSRTVPNWIAAEVAGRAGGQQRRRVRRGEPSQRRLVEVVVVQVREQHAVDRPGIGRGRDLAAQVRDAVAQHGVGDHAARPASRAGRWRGRAT